MNPQDREDLLWRLGLGDGEADGATPDDALLVAYREGDLPGEKAAEIERLLAASPAARTRLVELAGQRRGTPPSEVRARVLGAFVDPGSVLQTAVRDRRPRGPGWRWGSLAAAAVLAAVTLVGVVRQLTPRPLQPDLAYDVVVTGLSPLRSDEPTPGPVEAFADTILRIAATPADGAVEGVEAALYLQHRGWLRRVQPGPRLQLSTERGATLFEARAGDLLGGEPGTHELYVVVARTGDLPPEERIVAEDPERTLAQQGRRLVYRRTIVLRPDDGSS